MVIKVLQGKTNIRRQLLENDPLAYCFLPICTQNKQFNYKASFIKIAESKVILEIIVLFLNELEVSKDYYHGRVQNEFLRTSFHSLAKIKINSMF